MVVVDEASSEPAVYFLRAKTPEAVLLAMKKFIAE